MTARDQGPDRAAFFIVDEHEWADDASSGRIPAEHRGSRHGTQQF
jgi:hypothetical protein